MAKVKFQVSAIVTDEATTVEITTEDWVHGVTGWAKKHPNDEPNEVVGYNLAMARALSKLSDVYAQMAAEEMEGDVTVGDYVFEYEETDPDLETEEWMAELLAAVNGVEK